MKFYDLFRFLMCFIVGVLTSAIIVHFISSKTTNGAITKNRCIETDSIISENGKRVVIHFRDCPNGGTIQISSNKPIFGKTQAAKIMASDNVIGLDAVGYGYRLDTEADRRTCTIKYHSSREDVTKTICDIIHSY